MNLELRIHNGKQWRLYDVEILEELYWENLNLVLHENPLPAKKDERIRLTHKESGLELFAAKDRKTCRESGLAVLKQCGKPMVAKAILNEIGKT